MKIKVLYLLKTILCNGPTQFKLMLFKGYLCMHTRTRARAHTHTRAHTRTHTGTHTCAHTWAHMHTHTHTGTHTRAHTRAHTHTHTHTQGHIPPSAAPPPLPHPGPSLPTPATFLSGPDSRAPSHLWPLQALLLCTRWKVCEGCAFSLRLGIRAPAAATAC